MRSDRIVGQCDIDYPCQSLTKSIDALCLFRVSMIHWPFSPVQLTHIIHLVRTCDYALLYFILLYEYITVLLITHDLSLLHTVVRYAVLYVVVCYTVALLEDNITLQLVRLIQTPYHCLIPSAAELKSSSTRLSH